MGLLIALFIVCIGIGFAGYSALSGDRVGCVTVALLGVLWLRVNKPVEGPILVTLTETHGITVADLFTVACFGMAVAGWIRWRHLQRVRRKEAEQAQLKLAQARLAQARRTQTGTGQLTAIRQPPARPNPSTERSPETRPNPRLRRH